MTGKISSLPHAIREQLNLRLEDHQDSDTILPWLNSLPEVQAILKEKFDAQLVNPHNLSEYRTRAFRRWQIQRAALEFAAESTAQAPEPVGSPLLGESGGGEGKFLASPSSAHSIQIAQLVDWASRRLAAAAHSAPIPEDPDADLRQLRQFLADIVALRRGELISRRIALEEQRLAFSRAKDEEELEQLFWQWTKRPDIQSMLYPHRDPDKLRRDVVRMLDRELLGRNHNGDDLPEPDPACSI